MTASSWPMYYAMLYGHWVIFIFAPVALFKAGWPVTGGLVMLLSTLMPIAGQVWFTDSDAPGLVFLLILELPMAAMVLLAGIAMQLTALLNRRRIPIP